MFNPVEIIRTKRDGAEISPDRLAEFIKEFTAGNVSDYQMSAFMMAVYFQNMTVGEMSSLVHAMRESGNVLDLSDLKGVKLDKHSTGGVGDKISLILAPLLASMGLIVPMISGRGLGHSGGTLDKLESIPGLDPKISLPRMKKVIEKVGFVIAGQTDELVPADRKMYALRDMTATVESLPLVVGSIMSKKLSEDLDGLILDVKTGKGSFFPNEQDAIHLAKLLIKVGEGFGVKTRALLTNMNTPIGNAIGNWVEVYESIECLLDKGPEDTMELVYAQGLAAMQLSGDDRPANKIVAGLRNAISSGIAMEKFTQYVGEVGGDVGCVENYQDYQLPPKIEVRSAKSGFVTAINAFEIGIATNNAGAGRTKASDRVDPVAGVILKKKVMDEVEVGEPLAYLYTQKREKSNLQNQISGAFQIQEKRGHKESLILGEVDRNGQLVPFKVK